MRAPAFCASALGFLRMPGVFGLLLLAGALVFAALPAGPVAAQQSLPENLRSEPVDGAVPGEVLGTSSQSELWRGVRQGEMGRVSIPDANAARLVQSEGDNWRAIRNGPLSTYGVWAMLGMIGLLALFFLLRGRIRIEHGKSGRTITRFGTIERMAHWLLAVSFILLALTGLNILYGRYFMPQVIGAEAFGAITLWGKWIHNYVAFAFMLGLAMVLVMWVAHNLPSRHDLVWIARGGGMFTRGTHPPARKFNFGQKIVFWLVILGGVSISLSGIALMFPFEFSLFAKTFEVLNIFGLNLPTALTPIQEMQYAQVWHTMVAVFLIAVVIAHIYIGTVGMEGAFDAMGSGEVDYNWAREHHSLWVDEVEGRAGARPSGRRPAPEPAE